MAEQRWKTGDTWEPLGFTVVDADGNPVNVSPAAAVGGVRFIAKIQGGGTKLIQGAAIVLDPGGVGDYEGKGDCEYRWKLNDLDTEGTFGYEAEVTWDPTSNPPKIETFPGDAALNPTFKVTADLD